MATKKIEVLEWAKHYLENTTASYKEKMMQVNALITQEVEGFVQSSLYAQPNVNTKIGGAVENTAKGARLQMLNEIKIVFLHLLEEGICD